MPVIQQSPSTPRPNAPQTSAPSPAPAPGSGGTPADTQVIDRFEQNADRGVLRKAEKALKKAGFSVGKVDGSFTGATRNALRRFQDATGMEASGTLTQKTFRRLGDVVERMEKKKGVVGPGQKSQRIRTLERQLRRLGYSPGAVDGVYSDTTAKAVKAFKKQNDVDSKSGLFGDAAQKVLNREVKQLAHDPYRARVKRTAAHKKEDRQVTEAVHKERAGGPRGLERGMKGAAVKTIREHLRAAGYDAGIGKTFSARTEAMVKVFQEKVDLEPTGRVNGKTWKALRKAKMEAKGPTSPHQQIGERSGAVKRTEELLKKLGYSPGDVDGHYDGRTQKALDRFRKKKDLGGVGNGVGPSTLSALKKAVKNLGSGKAKRQMRNLLRVAKRNAEGKQPLGWCLREVQNYLDQVTYGTGRVPRLPYARNYAEYLNRDGNAARLGLKRLDIDNPYDAPPGAIVVVRAGTPGTAHPTAGDIVVRGHGSKLYNDGEMSYGGPGNFPPGNNYVLGVYVPRGYAR